VGLLLMLPVVSRDAIEWPFTTAGFLRVLDATRDSDRGGQCLIR
jgi:hypothetical protein